VRASPGGLGRAERYDVFKPATVTLREAMAEAADRDRIARQYVTDFADVFGLGEPVFAAALAAFRTLRRPKFTVRAGAVRSRVSLFVITPSFQTSEVGKTAKPSPHCE